ncbi:MAG: MFS transporter [Thermoanaerobaculia bacterium]
MISPFVRRPYHALQHRDFRRLGAALLVSLTGSQMQSVAIDWHVYLLTHSPLMLGLVGLVRVVPIVVFSLWGGIVADRHDRRRVMLAAEALMTVVASVLAYVTLSGRDSVPAVFALTAISAGAVAFDNPARQALLPRLVPAQDLPGALAVMLTVFQAAQIAGPALAGLLIAGGHGLFGHAVGESLAAAGVTSRKGLGLIYLVNAVSFLAVLIALLVMKTSGEVERAPGDATGALESLREGLRFVFHTPIMVSTMTLDFFATFFSGSMSLLPIFADQILKAGPVGYGWLRAAPGIGAIFGSLYITLRPLPERQGRALLGSVAAYGAATIVFGLSRSIILTFIALAATGLADTISTIVRQTVRQLVTPDALRGRMTSVNMIFFMGGPQLGELEAGFLASLFASAAVGASVSVVTGGAATILIVAGAALFSPVIREYRSSRDGALRAPRESSASRP